MSGQTESRIVPSCVLPWIGCASYDMFSVTVTVPKMYIGWTGNRSGLLADILWFNAHIGIGLYIYQQPFMRRATTKCRVIYTAFSTALFNFGSALIWGTVRTLMPVQYSKLKILFGTGSGLLFLHIGWNFIQFLNFLAVDNQNKV